MATLIQYAITEIADNWPAFVYILMTIGFSFFFFRERRAEARLLRQMGEGIHENIRSRFDRLEFLVRNSTVLERQAKKGIGIEG